MLITFYSIIHTIGHLVSKLKELDEEEDMDETNEIMTYKEFKSHKSYAELLF